MKKTIIALATILATTLSYANTDSLRNKITEYCSNYKATVGISVIFIEDADTLSVNGHKMLPMLSVYKLPIAMCVLNNVDKGELTLNTPINISNEDMHQNTWSPLRNKLNGADNCCDILLKAIGGIETVQTYLKQIGLPNIQVNNTEWQIFQSPNLIYNNQATPCDITTLLCKLYSNNLFSNSCFNFLWHTLTDCTTGNNRIKRKLPKETEVAHKTGTSFTTKEGITPAINDVGIITLPNGKHVAVAIFVSESRENRETNERIIADLTEIIWEYSVNR